MADPDFPHLPDKEPSLQSVHQCAIQRARQLDLLLETALTKPEATSMKTARFKIYMNKLLKKFLKRKNSGN